MNNAEHAHQRILHALDQADAALGIAGLPPEDIIRSELRSARGDIANLLLSAAEIDSVIRSPARAASESIVANIAGQFHLDAIIAEMREIAKEHAEQEMSPMDPKWFIETADRLAALKAAQPAAVEGERDDPLALLAGLRGMLCVWKNPRMQIERFRDALKEDIFPELDRLEAALSAQPAAVEDDLAAFDAAVTAELPCVSVVLYNSHEICKWFAANVRERMTKARAALSAQPVQPALVPAPAADEREAEPWEVELLAWLKRRGLYDPALDGDECDICDLLDQHEAELLSKIPEDKRTPLQRTMDAIESVRPAADACPMRLLPDVDQLAQHIRFVDGRHEMGAGLLAESICEWLKSHPALPERAEVSAAESAEAAEIEFLEKQV